VADGYDGPYRSLDAQVPILQRGGKKMRVLQDLDGRRNGKVNWVLVANDFQLESLCFLHF
jgi:hypothetical protein